MHTCTWASHSLNSWTVGTTWCCFINCKLQCVTHTHFLTASVHAAERTKSLQRCTGSQWQTGWGHPNRPPQTGWYRGDWGDRGWRLLCRTCPHLTWSSTCWLDNYKADGELISQNIRRQEVEFWALFKGQVPFYGDDFVSAFASVDSPEGAWVRNRWADNDVTTRNTINWTENRRWRLPDPIISLNSSSDSWRWKWDGRLARSRRTSAFSENRQQCFKKAVLKAFHYEYDDRNDCRFFLIQCCFPALWEHLRICFWQTPARLSKCWKNERPRFSGDGWRFILMEPSMRSA